MDQFKNQNPGAQAFYNKGRGGDTLEKRIRKKYPNLPKVCQAKGCGERRVLEFAHRPKFKRNGAWRKVSMYQPNMIWVLCPTCHRVLDKGIETPEEMGLPQE